MKCFEIVTRVVVHDEATLLKAAGEQYDRDGGEGAGEEEIKNPRAALDELSHLGDPCHPSGERGPYDCGIELLGREVREIATKDPNPFPARPSDLVGHVMRREVREVREVKVPPCFPPEVAQAHAPELRQALANLLEWNAQTVRSEASDWKSAKTLMTQIRNEEDAVREGER